MSYITSVSYKVLFNGEVTSSFRPGCGLRQGDPLSPYIFWRPVKVSRGGPGISHLFFANALILFGQANVKQASTMKKCIDMFCENSGQQVHLINWEIVGLAKNKGDLGIKCMKKANQAFLAKASWRLVKNEESLWAKVINCKYLKGKNIFEGEKDKGRKSCVWRGILHGAKCLSKGIIWRVGNGKSINFWKDNWVPKIGTLKEHALMELGENLLSLKVEDLLDGGRWELGLLNALLPAEIVLLIISIHAGHDGSGEDKAMWGSSNDGNFSVRIAYNSMDTEVIEI
ncbi:hypothetical protein ACOSQ4_012804 [Xanthoceras sorbifolium]